MSESENKPVEPEYDLIEHMAAVLKGNDHGTHISPAKLYPHQWLWDSCFIAIGLRHLDPERAAEEVANLIRGQWANGMIPNMIFNPGRAYRWEREAWRSWSVFCARREGESANHPRDSALLRWRPYGHRGERIHRH